MSSYCNVERSTVISVRPCILYTVIVYNTGGDEGVITIYDGIDVDSGRKIATLLCGSKDTTLYAFNGIDCLRGLYVEFVEKAEEVMVEYVPLCSGD